MELGRECKETHVGTNDPESHVSLIIYSVHVSQQQLQLLPLLDWDSSYPRLMFPISTATSSVDTQFGSCLILQFIVAPHSRKARSWRTCTEGQFGEACHWLPITVRWPLHWCNGNSESMLWSSVISAPNACSDDSTVEASDLNEGTDYKLHWLHDNVQWHVRVFRLIEYQPSRSFIV